MENTNSKTERDVLENSKGCCPLYRVQAGCYGDPEQAEQAAARLRAEGYRAFVIFRR